MELKQPILYPENATHLDACPVCASSVGLWKTKQTEYGEFPLDRCKGCGFVFVNPRPSLPYLMDFYSRFVEVGGAESPEAVLEQEKAFPNASLDAQRLIGTSVRLLSTDNPSWSRTLFDIGSGRGLYSLEAQRQGFDVSALEISETDRMITHSLTGIDPVSVPFESYDPQGRKFDVILMSQILEHVMNVNDWISKSRDLLAHGGVIAIALPNFDSIFRYFLAEKDPFITPPEHLNFFGEGNLARLLEKHGLTVLERQWTSRLMPQAYSRLPFGDLYAPASSLVGGFALGLSNAFRRSMFLTLYAGKL